jgi:heme-degrading monooxygenase HmoA
MFINIMQFPSVAEEKEAEFQEWFAWSNEQYAGEPGFIRRRLLKARKGGNYVAIIEHESYDTFMEMHNSPAQARAKERLESLLDGSPTPQFYEVVVA